MAIGAVLSQLRNRQERPVAYCSRQLNSAERNYNCTERELLAVIFATKQFRSYLYGHRFTLYTNHSALRWLLNLKDPSSRLTRWSLRLAEFDYEVIHKPGKKLPHADALSRNVTAIYYEENISVTKMKEAQKSDQFCRTVARSAEFLENDQETQFLSRLMQETRKLLKSRNWRPLHFILKVMEFVKDFTKP